MLLQCNDLLEKLASLHSLECYSVTYQLLRYFCRTVKAPHMSTTFTYNKLFLQQCAVQKLLWKAFREVSEVFCFCISYNSEFSRAILWLNQPKQVKPCQANWITLIIILCGNVMLDNVDVDLPLRHHKESTKNSS